MIKSYFKIAWRNLVRNRAYAAINILGLTLGVSACLVIYLITSFELSYDTFHPDKERIYRVVSVIQKADGDRTYLARVPDPVAASIQNEFTGIETVAHFQNHYGKVTVPSGDKDVKIFDAPNLGAERSDIIVTDASYFAIFPYQWLAGNITSFADPLHVVLTESKAQKYFGSIPTSEMIGKEVIYNDSLRLTVCGVVKDFGKNSDFIFNDFISFATVQNSFLKERFRLDNWKNFSPLSQTFVKLEKGVTIMQFERQTTGLVKRRMDLGKGISVSLTLQPLSDIHFNAAYEDTYGRRAHLPTLYGLMAIAVFILLIAAINFINLSTAQSLQRMKEIGIRKVLGSRRAGLVFQFLTETFILTLFAVVISIFITPVLLSTFYSFVPDGVHLYFSASMVIFLLFVTLITSLLAGLYPAKVLSSFLPVLSLKGTGKKTINHGNYFRKGLIVFQFTISLVFIIGSLVIRKQINYVLNTDMGFAKDAIITIPTNWEYKKDKKEVLANQIKQLTGIQLVSTAMGTPIEKKHSNTFIKCAAISDEPVGSEYQTGDENYTSLYQIKLIAGRNLSASDTMKEFLINETCAKKIGFKSPQDAIGKIAEIGTSDAAYPKMGPIVGVVADFHSQSLHEPISPTFITTSNSFSRTITVKLSTLGKQVGNFKETIAKIERLWKGVFPHDTFEYKFFDDTIARFYEKEQKTEQVMNAAMSIAILISCMGLFGLATFTAKQRTKEIGIRKVLGASVTGIVSLLSKDFLKPVMIAIIIASPIAYYFMKQWLQGFAFRINISWWIFLLAAALAIAITIITVSFQAIKAATTNPVKSLRSE